MLGYPCPLDDPWAVVPQSRGACLLNWRKERIVAGEGGGGGLGWGPRGLPGSQDLKNLCTTYWPNRTTPRIVITIRIGSLRRFRAATCREERGGLQSGGAAEQQGGVPTSGAYPAASLRNPPGDAMVQYDIRQKAGHLAQEAGQTTLVDIQGQAVAEAQESHHTAPADAALK